MRKKTSKKYTHTHTSSSFSGGIHMVLFSNAHFHSHDTIDHLLKFLCFVISGSIAFERHVNCKLETGIIIIIFLMTFHFSTCFQHIAVAMFREAGHIEDNMFCVLAKTEHFVMLQYLFIFVFVLRLIFLFRIRCVVLHTRLMRFGPGFGGPQRTIHHNEQH